MSFFNFAANIIVFFQFLCIQGDFLYSRQYRNENDLLTYRARKDTFREDIYGKLTFLFYLQKNIFQFVCWRGCSVQYGQGQKLSAFL